MAEKELLSIENFMDIYSQKRNTTYKEIKNGRLLVTKVGYRTFIRRVDADAWMNALSEMTIPDPAPL